MAIAFDAQNSTFVVGSTTVSRSHTVTSATPFPHLTGAVITLAGDTLTSLTFNSVAMTQVAKVAIPTQGWFVYLYSMPAPPVGSSYNMVATSSASTNIFLESISHTGVAQTSPVDVFSTNTAATAASLTCNLTTTVADCWTMMWAASGASNLTASTGFTARGTNPDQFIFGDSNAGLSVGSTSMAVTSSPNSNIAGVMMALKPVATFVPRITAII